MPTEQEDEEWRSEIDEDVFEVEENGKEEGAEVEIILHDNN